MKVMKKKGKTKQAKQKVTKAELRKFEAWWAELPPLDKKWAYETGVLMQAFKGGLASNVLVDSSTAEEALKEFMSGLGEVYDKASPGWQQNKPATRGLN